MSPRLIVSSCLTATFLVACAEPCTDDGLLQDDRGADCPVLADDSGSSTTGPMMSTTTTGGETVTYCADRDGDGRGDPNSCQEVPPGEVPPPGTVTNADDCADGNPDAFVGAAAENPEACTQDADGDGYGDANPPEGIVPGTDCDDADATTSPAAAENEPEPGCFQDEDEDGFGDADPPEGVDAGTDCDDDNPDVFPGVGENDGTACTIDLDGDGFGDADPPDGIDPGSDCDDDNPNVFPGAASEESATACTIDLDGDGFGDADPPSGVEAGGDCDDSDANTFPGAAQLDDVDACMKDTDDDGYGDNVPPGGVTPGTDCDDEDSATPEVNTCNTWCVDADGDGFGDPMLCMEVEGGLDGYVNNAADCADDNASAFPGAALEEGDLCTIDADGDGYGDDSASEIDPDIENGTDCSDDNEDVHPGAEHEPTLCTIDADGDGYGDADASDIDPDAQDGSDCVDDNEGIFPGAASEEPELCTIDADGDGYGDSTISDSFPGAENGSDCNDSASGVVECLSVDAGTCMEATPVTGAALEAVATGGSGDYTYAWTPATGLSATDIANPVATPDNYQSYEVTASDGFSSATDTVTVISVDPFDLAESCELVSFDLANNEGPPSISYSNGGTVACEEINGDVGLHLCGVDFENTRLEGSMRVNDLDGDDDNIGFVWGAEDASHFYHFTWKRTNQTQQAAVAVCPDGGTNVWPGGMLVKRVDADAPADMTLQDLFCNFDTPNSTLLRSPTDLTTDGWEFGVDYSVVLDFTSEQTTISITNTMTDVEIINFSVDTSATANGRFGTLTFSQSGACNGPWNASCIE